MQEVKHFQPSIQYLALMVDISSYCSEETPISLGYLPIQMNPLHYLQSSINMLQVNLS